MAEPYPPVASAPLVAPIGEAPRPLWARFKAFPGWLFPKDSGEAKVDSGFAGTASHGGVYLLLALGIAIAFAALWDWSTIPAPIPPGDDPSTWILTSYPFVGLPYPSQINLLGYPPAAFPFIGISVLLGGGPLEGGRIFTMGTILALGIAMYVFGRTLLVRPVFALLGEGLLLAEPDFQQIFYFGGYPNVFALIFLLLAVSFFVMYLRSRRPVDVALFWTFTAVCILSHSLTAVILLGTLALLAVGLLLARRLPRTIVLSRGGIVGVAIAAVSVGGYYALTHFLKISHPSYFGSTGTLSGYPTVLLPFHIGVVGKALTGSAINLGNSQTAELLVAATLVILALVLLVRFVRSRWYTTPWIVVAAGILAVFLEALVGYVLNISTDYRRFEYFLYAPLIGAVLLSVESLLDATLAWWAERSARVTASAAPEAGARARRWRAAWNQRGASEVALLGIAIVIILAVGYFYTVPAGQSYEAYFTLYAHSQSFIGLVDSIMGSGVAGNLLTTSPFSGHWPSTLSSRVTYVPAPLGTVNSEFSQVQLQNSELAQVTLGDRYFVTNSLVGAGVPGISPNDFNSTPDVGVFVNAFYQEVIRLPPSGIAIGLVNATNSTSIFTPFPAGTGAPAVTEIDGGYGYQISATSSQGVRFVEAVTIPLGSPTVNIQFSVYANASWNPAYIQARLATIPFISTALRMTGVPGQFDWNTTTKAGNLSTVGNVTPSNGLVKVAPYNITTGATATAVLRSNATDQYVGASVLSLGLNLTTSGAFNVLTSLGPWIQADQTWSGWNIRFVLEYNGTTSLALVTPEYLQAEYGAAELAQAGGWWVYVLPQWAPVTPVGGAVALQSPG